MMFTKLPSGQFSTFSMQPLTSSNECNYSHANEYSMYVRIYHGLHILQFVAMHHILLRASSYSQSTMYHHSTFRCRVCSSVC